MVSVRTPILASGPTKFDRRWNTKFMCFEKYILTQQVLRTKWKWATTWEIQNSVISGSPGHGHVDGTCSNFWPRGNIGWRKRTKDSPLQLSLLCCRSTNKTTIYRCIMIHRYIIIFTYVYNMHIAKKNRSNTTQVYTNLNMNCHCSCEKAEDLSGQAEERNWPN